MIIFFDFMSDNTLADVIKYAQCAANSDDATIADISAVSKYLDDKYFNTISVATKEFGRMFKGFDQFIDGLPSNVMVSGSTCLSAFSKKNKFRPNDVDLYIKDCKPETIKRVDTLIRGIYEGHKMVMIRSPYILSWSIVDETTERIIVSYQLILSPAPHWSHVFAGYHSDLVCIGYTNGRFIYAQGRWDVFARTKKATFFADLVSMRFQPRVSDACTKYRKRGFDVEFQKRTMDLGMKDIERSDPIHLKFEGSTVKLAEELVDRKYGIYKIGVHLHEVYFGEAFKPIIESMSCFTACPRCGVYVFAASFCKECEEKEVNLLKGIRGILSENSISSNALITGGRCGLGAEIKRMLKDCGARVAYTSRYPNGDADAIELDLMKPETWSVCSDLLESGDINLLVLSAAETLHYDTPPILGGALDWTGDFERPNTGVWHKTLDEHSYDELTHPLLINVAGCAALLGKFLMGAKKHVRKNYCAIVVTSYEGRFETKSPFHPITNASKAAIEQVVWTIQRQVASIGDHVKVVLADPGWMYTESSFGKIKGPVPIEWGAAQILSPYVAFLSSPTEVANASVWRRQGSVGDDVLCMAESAEAKATLIKKQELLVLEPCGHVIKCKFEFNCNFCPECGAKVTLRDRSKISICIKKTGMIYQLENIGNSIDETTLDCEIEEEDERIESPPKEAAPTLTVKRITKKAR